MNSSKAQAVPTQEEGQQADIIETLEASDSLQAKLFFVEARNKLLDIAGWGNTSEGISAEFTLTGRHGEIKDGLPVVGDHIRINIPGPGSSAGSGYDWVRIEFVEEISESDNEYAVLRVRPSADPKSSRTRPIFLIAEQRVLL